MANTTIGFEVLTIKDADKKDYAMVDVKFDGSEKVYTYIRKSYEKSGNFSTIIDAVRIEYSLNDYGEYEVYNMVRIGETKGKKRTSTVGLSGERKKKNIVDEIKATIIDEQIEIPPVKFEGEVKHKEFETIKSCIDADIPVYLAGPAGSGKNHTLEQIAKELGLEFYFTNSVQQEYKLTGFIDAGGNYHETEFYKAFVNGGIFFLDEMDASIPEVLVLLNAAIANKYFEFPNGKVTAHEDFRVVAAGNTVGSGADECYTGRMVLDQATLDRFVIIEFDYDKNIELFLANGNAQLVDFIEDLREVANKFSIRATFSYRCISMVAKLENKMHIDQIIKIAVVKGLDKDTINILSSNIQNRNKYSNALKSLVA